jgi:hypothetical protein
MVRTIGVAAEPAFVTVGEAPAVKAKADAPTDCPAGAEAARLIKDSPFATIPYAAPR